MRFGKVIAICFGLMVIAPGCAEEPLSSYEERAPEISSLAMKIADVPEPAASGLSGYLTLEANGETIVYEGESRDDPAPRYVRFDGDGATLEFTDFRMGISSGREGSSGEATARRVVRPAWCRMWVSGAFPLLMQAQIQNQVCRGTYTLFASAAAGEELIKTWSISFENGRINRVELVTDSDPTTPDYVELEIVADPWTFNRDSASRR